MTLSLVKVNAQYTEDFETITIGSTDFSNNGQLFTISSNSSPDTFQVSSFNDVGWNGTVVDQNYIDNFTSDNDNDDTSFIISTTDGTDIVVKSL